LIEATQWFENGDHPHDESEPSEGSSEKSEGKVVQRFHSVDLAGNSYCPECGNRMQRHGVLDGANGEEFVCPGDYIVTDRNGLYSRVSRAEFESHNEPYVRPPRFAERRLSDPEERKQRRSLHSEAP
jgi:tRNA(Ile2) C34 agmatinyltransferase TiaS